ncbi:MAG TPA: DUF6328 family protein [Baekduia sp.]|nr:DUF6328 family protein [Baekduia sp.]
MPTDRDEARSKEDEAERLDRELVELLQELRVAIPGVQVLFGFLLTVPFQQGFRRITEFQEYVYFVTLLLTAAATVFLIAPTAYHRIMFRARDKPRLIRMATAQALTGLAFLALALNGAILLITDLLFEETTVIAIVAISAVTFAWLWFGLGLSRRIRKDSTW